MSAEKPVSLGPGLADLGSVGSRVCAELVDGLRIGYLRWSHLHAGSWLVGSWSYWMSQDPAG